MWRANRWRAPSLQMLHGSHAGAIGEQYRRDGEALRVALRAGRVSRATLTFGIAAVSYSEKLRCISVAPQCLMAQCRRAQPLMARPLITATMRHCLAVFQRSSQQDTETCLGGTSPQAIVQNRLVLHIGYRTTVMRWVSVWPSVCIRRKYVPLARSLTSSACSVRPLAGPFVTISTRRPSMSYRAMRTS